MADAVRRKWKTRALAAEAEVARLQEAPHGYDVRGPFGYVGHARLLAEARALVKEKGGAVYRLVQVDEDSRD